MERRFCNYTFVPEEDIGGDGDTGRLLRCSRCKDTYYRDAEAQRAHWPLHKKVCKPLDVAEREFLYTFDSKEVALSLIGGFTTPEIL
jgi:MYND finger